MLEKLHHWNVKSIYRTRVQLGLDLLTPPPATFQPHDTGSQDSGWTPLPFACFKDPSGYQKWERWFTSETSYQQDVQQLLREFLNPGGALTKSLTNRVAMFLIIQSGTPESEREALLVITLGEQVQTGVIIGK